MSSPNPLLTEAERAALEAAKVGIAGAGGLGSNCAAHLVRAGVRRLVIADFDVVAESNLNRQFYFRDQIGRKKVDALAENLRRIEPGLELELACERLDGARARELFADCDVVVEMLTVQPSYVRIEEEPDRSVLVGSSTSFDLSVRCPGGRYPVSYTLTFMSNLRRYVKKGTVTITVLEDPDE